ncbi:MAG: S41 family peptidase [Bacteroidales bacterium]
MDSKFSKFLRIAAWGVTIVLLVVLIIRVGKRKNVVNLSGVDSNWAKLMLILNCVDKDYVDAIDYDKVTEDILPDIMSQLDPHSVYLPPQELKESEESLQGGFGGIGIQFNVPNDTAIVTNVIVGGPSEKAGLMTGDRIVKVDTVTIAGVKMPQDSMMLYMRGKEGSKVEITVKREGAAKPVSFNIVRGKIPLNSIDVSFMINDTTGYMKLSKFSKTSHYEFLTAMSLLRDKGIKKLIFDLRDNPGGYLDQALRLSNEFLKKGELVVYMEGRNRPRQDFTADGHGGCQDLELAVLINEGSASSSEIFAGAMQDNDRGTIIGLRSFGKGLVQDPVFFSDGSGIRLTVARFYTPTGRCIQKPYSDDYYADIYERYVHGEMMSADSIKVNDSLRFTTPKGKTVYGGGGIVPDIFVPIDTVGVTDFMVNCNRQSLLIKYANELADKNRKALRNIHTMNDLNVFLDKLDLGTGFLAYAKVKEVVPKDDEWKISGDIMVTQLRALIGRYTPMDNEGFYPIYLTLDNVTQKALENRATVQ